MREKNNADGKITSGEHLSFWTSSVKPLVFSPLSQDIETDVAVVGAGISGLSAAYCLAKSGKKVVVLEDGNVGSGETGRTTAHLVNAIDDFYSELERLHGSDNAKLLAESHTAAIDFVESVTREERIHCDFRRLNGYLFLHPTDDIKTLEEELDASTRAGLRTAMVAEVPGMSNQTGPSLRFPSQAQFHPMKYLHGLAHAITRYGGEIFTGTHVSDFGKNELKANGFTVKARDIVVATNTPVNDRFTIHTKQHAYRTYVIVATIPKGSVEPALWWDTGDHDSKWVVMPYNYVRIYEYDEESDLIIHGGQDHKTGQPDTDSPEDSFATLEKWLRSKFPATQAIKYKWSGQVEEPVDCVAYIGKNPGDEHVYVITGDSGNGMTHGTIGGMLVADLINGKSNPWEKIYDPARITLRSAGDYIKENVNVAAQYAELLTAGDLDSAKELALNEGAVIRSGLKKLAVYRDGKGTLHAYTAICPHLGCVVQWNPVEKSFDCPCHGSRFTHEGKVVNGPATGDLKKMQVSDK